jgi:tetratricopeptide (TPR) repeat protein
MNAIEPKPLPQLMPHSVSTLLSQTALQVASLQARPRQNSAKILTGFMAVLACAGFLWCSMALPVTASAQQLRMKRSADADLGTRDLGVRYLKLGNTYREARNYDLAQLYIKKGLDMVRNRGSRYWEAAGYEYLGLIYRDMGERELALEYLRVSQGIFANILNTRDGVGSDDALKLVIADIERGADRIPPASQRNMIPNLMMRPISPEMSSPDADRLRTDNQRLQDVNRQLTNRIADLEDRIRRLETESINRSLNNTTTTPDISECKRDIEAIARYRESVLWSNNYTPQNLQTLGARVSDQNTKVNGTIVTGYLKKGESVKIELDVNPGIYAIIADGCSGKARDIDVRIINQRGVVLEKKDIRFSTSADVSTDGNRITETRTTNSNGGSTVSEERSPNTSTNANSSTNSTQATMSADGGDMRVRPSSTRDPLARLSWNAEYAGTHTFLVTMYDCEPEGAYFCFVIGRK